MARNLRNELKALEEQFDKGEITEQEFVDGIIDIIDDTWFPQDALEGRIVSDSMYFMHDDGGMIDFSYAPFSYSGVSDENTEYINEYIERTIEEALEQWRDEEQMKKDSYYW